MSIGTPSEPDSELEQLVAKLKEKTGSPEIQFQRAEVLRKWVIESSDDYRILCYGDVYLTNHIGPAVLVYDKLESKVVAMAPMGKTNMVSEIRPSYFHSRIPYAAIAREVAGGNDTI